MSVSLWRWTEECDHDYCPGDCDICYKAEEDLSEQEKENQCNDIVRYMTLNGGITQAEAFKIGVGRLSARIYDLRHKDGYLITTQNITKKNSRGRTSRYARYVFTNSIARKTDGTPKRETPEPFGSMEQLVSDFFADIAKVTRGARK